MQQAKCGNSVRIYLFLFFSFFFFSDFHLLHDRSARDQTPFTGPVNLGVVELRVAVASCGTVVVASGNLPVASWDGCSCELLVAVAIAVAVASCGLQVRVAGCEL